ncbi:MAG TPA: MASE4 domain-containing protein [Pseudolabrys sp.]|nr:MASE4 domain-containing protein [Pseudolabrys sp.]
MTAPSAKIDIRPSSEREFPIVFANTPTTSGERRIALGIVGLLSAVALAVAPIARVHLGRLDAFVPALQTVLCGAELTTALLLFGQYYVKPQYALLALASGYITSGLFAFLHSLTFPGAYAPTGLFGGPDTGAWLYCFWHIGFPLSVITYAVLRDWKGTEAHDRSPRRTIGLVVASTLAAIAAIAWAVSVDASMLPPLYEQDLRTQTAFTSYLTGAILLLNIIALVFMVWRTRMTLDLWLSVALFAALPDLLLPTILPAPRFSVAWYVARGYALITSLTVLSLLLIEMTVLYQRLAASVVLARRERANRAMSLDVATSAIVHEIMQPLTAISLSTQAGLSWLAKQPPNIDGVREDFKDVVEQVDRADAILKSIRSLFQSTANQAQISVEEIVDQVLRLLQHDLQTNHVSVQKNYASARLNLVADPMQLQEVVLNLVKNAIDAMDTQATSIKQLRVTTHRRDSLVVLQIDDSGFGIPAEARDRIFDPFFTTKKNGMGLGLSICRQIVEAHGGNLTLAESGHLGTSFQIELPLAKAPPP